MSRFNVSQVGSRAAVAGTLLVWALMHQAPTAAASAEWDARVQGTANQGLQVRQGPGSDFPTIGVVSEGTTVHVVEGPRFDRDGHSWYRITGFNRAGSSGWSSGDYLLGSPPASVDAQTQQQGAGAGGFASSSQSFMAVVTAYTYQTPGNGAHGSVTKSGTVAHWGTVAVDPRVIPLGTHLMIDGYDDVFTAEDTGGAVQGDHVEIFFLDTASALQFGVQRRSVTVLTDQTQAMSH